MPKSAFAIVFLFLGRPMLLQASEDTCANPAGCPSGTETGESLLQKTYRREANVALHESEASAEQEMSQTPACTGTWQQGKCWYLSEQGETCAETCTKNGRAFSFVVADNDDPLVPKLVGHEPHGKQSPWATLECYVSKEDRYHTANANAAKHYVGDIGEWKHDDCALSCPCGDAGECRWEQPPACATEFEWKGVLYSGCPTIDHDGPWCQHHHHHTEKDEAHDDDWSHCVYTCGTKGAIKKDEGCHWELSSSCVKEFDYEGTHYVGCTATDHDTPWCSNMDPYDGSWNHCEYKCKDKKDEEEALLNRETQNDNLLCSWKPKAECSKSFEYKGVDYEGCAVDVDHPTPWCSHDRVHKGSWVVCDRVCTSPKGETSPTSPPPSPPPPTQSVQPSGPACERHPETENDQIGNSVTLDEAGYKIAATANSPINMKRFICRVISKIDCVANDYSALMGFVPYYSGLVSHQTYAHLEHELTTLCHAGGKWVTTK